MLLQMKSMKIMEDWNDAAVYEEGGNGAFIGKADIKRVETELYRDRTYPVVTSQR